MSDELKPALQKSFNDVAYARNLDDLQQALDGLDAHSADDRKQLIDVLEKSFIEDFSKDLPRKQEELDAVIALRAAFGGNEADAEDAETVQGFFLLADKIVTEKGDKAAPVLHKMLEKVATLTDEEYNNPVALLKTVVAAMNESTADKAAPKTNPFRNRGNKGPNA